MKNNKSKYTSVYWFLTTWIIIIHIILNAKIIKHKRKWIQHDSYGNVTYSLSSLK